MTKMMNMSVSTRMVLILHCCFSGAAGITKGSEDAAVNSFHAACIIFQSMVLHIVSLSTFGIFLLYLLSLVATSIKLSWQLLDSDWSVVEVCRGLILRNVIWAGDNLYLWFII